MGYAFTIMIKAIKQFLLCLEELRTVGDESLDLDDHVL